MKISRSISSLAMLLSSAGLARAQIQIVDSGAIGNQVNVNGAYTQNFDTLNGTSETGSWVSNETLTGWYATAPVLSKVPNLGLIDGGSQAGGGDRALGASGRNGADSYFALRLVNTSSLTITSFTITFDGEQWYRKANSPQVPTALSFSYKIFEVPEDGSHIYDRDWNYRSELDFVSPNATLTTSSFIDGNAPENSVRGLTSLVTGLSLAPGQELWLRWGSVDIAALVRVHNLTIDNLSVSFTAVPEPAAFSALLGLAGLALATRRRPRSAS
jgi:uncharacterized protein